MSGHCNDSLSYPQPGSRPGIDFEAEIDACKVKRHRDSTHTTKINNKRTGGIEKVEILVRAKYKGIILNGDPSITEYKFGFGMLRSGNSTSHGFPVTANPHISTPNDLITTTVVFYDSTEVNGDVYGTQEQASLKFTIDIS